eukprot:239999-Rhodomonas_salina.1
MSTSRNHMMHPGSAPCAPELQQNAKSSRTRRNHTQATNYNLCPTLQEAACLDLMWTRELDLQRVLDVGACIPSRDLRHPLQPPRTRAPSQRHPTARPSAGPVLLAPSTPEPPRSSRRRSPLARQSSSSAATEATHVRRHIISFRLSQENPLDDGQLYAYPVSGVLARSSQEHQVHFLQLSVLCRADQRCLTLHSRPVKKIAVNKKLGPENLKSRRRSEQLRANLAISFFKVVIAESSALADCECCLALNLMCTDAPQLATPVHVRAS